MSRPCIGMVVSCVLAALAAAGERVQHFDRDPGWDAVNNRAREPRPREVRQDFGYSAATANAGSKKGEIGGLITPAAEPAYYAKPIERMTFNDAFAASGKFICKTGQFHVLIALFNSETVNEWRTPNCIAIRLQGRGDKLYAFVEYATGLWRAGGDTPGGFATERDPATGRVNPRGFALNKVHRWSLRYEPNGNKGGGSIAVAIDDETSICHLDAGHKSDGATFNRFGLLNVMKSADTGGEVWLDDVSIGGKLDDFTADPKWEGAGNRRTYQSANVRPRFDFGFSATHFAGGKAAGELGGLVFRGDCRYAGRMACYGDRLKPLNLDKPLKASGKICLRRAVSDSTILLGFYHSADSMAVNPSQASGIPRSFLGIAVEGPSREGFFVYPVYRVQGDGEGYANGPGRPHLRPDGKPHDWSLEYDPRASGGAGRITVTLDRDSCSFDLGRGHRRSGARFDRFGLVTTWIDGNGQQIYFDDLTYTCVQ